MSAPGEEVGCLLARCREVITVVTSMASSHGDLRQPLPENVTCDVKEVYPQQSGQGRQLADCWVRHRQGNREMRKRGSDLWPLSSHDRHSLRLSPYHYHSQTKLLRTRYRLMTIAVRATVNKSMLVRGSLQPVARKLLYSPLRNRYPISRLHLRLHIQLYFLVSLSIRMNRQNRGSI